MLIKLDRSTMPLPYQESLWGVHVGKVWVAVRGGSARQYNNPDTVYGLVLSSVDRYDESGVYIRFDAGGRLSHRWLDVVNAIDAELEQHRAYADGAVWLWSVLGTCDKQYLVPDPSLFHLIPPGTDSMAWDRPWQAIAAIMCKSLCAAIARDEYARELPC